MKILLVDDIARFAMAMQALLRDHEVVWVVRSSTAILQMQEQDFDMVILDLVLEDTDAPETIALIPQMKHLQPNAKIIIISGLVDLEGKPTIYGCKTIHKGDEDFVSQLVGAVNAHA